MGRLHNSLCCGFEMGPFRICDGVKMLAVHPHNEINARLNQPGNAA